MSSTPDPTPARGRSRQSTTTALQDLPAYEPPVGPLTPNCQRALARLLQNEGLKNAQRHVQDASAKVSNAAGDINEKLTEARQRHARYLASERKRREKAESQGGNDEADADGGGGGGGLGKNVEEEEAKFRAREEEVERLTVALEEEIRRVVDSDIMLEDVKKWLADAVREIDEGATRGRGRRQLRHRRNDDEDEDEDGEEHEDEHEHDPSNEYSQRLAKDIESRRADWTAQSLTQRYSTNNTYVGFYRLVHDSKHPGNEIPPVPHSSTWFRHLEDPDAIDRNPPSSSRSAAKRTRRGARRSSPRAPDDDDEVAIARERTSLKCPLTLVQFVDPVTSTKCPHSFEKEAIQGMLSSSSLTIPAPEGSGHKRVKAVKCPVCEVQLSAEDLKDDLVLVRRVKRMQELMARMDEDEDDDEDEDESGSEGGDRRKRSRKGRQSGITLASDDGSEGESESESEGNEGGGRPIRIKQEALSQGM